MSALSLKHILGSCQLTLEKCVVWPLLETFWLEKPELQIFCHSLSLIKFKFHLAVQWACIVVSVKEQSQQSHKQTRLMHFQTQFKSNLLCHAQFCNSSYLPPQNTLALRNWHTDSYLCSYCGPRRKLASVQC